MEAGTGDVLLAFGLTVFGGLSTGIGSALALLTRRTSPRFLSVALGFSAGVMIYVSFVEILGKARQSLSLALGARGGAWAAAGSFFLGILVMGVIDRFIPEAENPHEAHTVEEMDGQSPVHRAHLMRMGLFTALALAIHNFPEGLATFLASLTDIRLGIPIAVAIAIHNVPEGIAVSVPIFYATGSRKKAFWYSFVSGLSEPVGAAIGYLLLRSFMTDVTFGVVFGAVAGIMVYISLDELLPAAREYGEHHLSIYGLIAGMAVMAVSLLLFA